MRLSGRPTLGTANIAAWVNIQVHFLSLSPTKVQMRISGIKERHELCWKEKQDTKVEVRWPEAIQRAGRWRGVDIRANTTKIMKSFCASPPAEQRCLHRPVEYPEILWSDEDVHYQSGLVTVCLLWDILPSLMRMWAETEQLNLTVLKKKKIKIIHFMKSNFCFWKKNPASTRSSFGNPTLTGDVW